MIKCMLPEEQLLITLNDFFFKIKYYIKVWLLDIILSY